MEELKTKEADYQILQSVVRDALNSRNFDAAIKKFLEEQDKYQDNEKYWVDLGTLYDHLFTDEGDRQAFTCYDRALKINPNFWGALSGKGRIYLHHKKPEAIEWYTKALEATDDPALVAGALFNLALAHEALEQFEEAEKYYQDSLKLTEGWQQFFALHALSNVYVKMNQPDKALQYAQKALDIADAIPQEEKERRLVQNMLEGLHSRVQYP